ncbi:MAG: helix-turn-helix domain-containing protein [Proteobacteria bacterium]|nr:helix-turn-helix domain-containing protein [Pseudomonadota bacterium]
MTISDDDVFANKPAWSIGGFERDFDTSSSEIYNMIARGQLVAVKAGRKTLITGDSVRAWWASLPPATIKPQQTTAQLPPAKIKATDMPPEATGPPNAGNRVGRTKTRGISQPVPA